MNHTTHFDDCGCKSAKMQSEIDALNERLRKADKLIKQYYNSEASDLDAEEYLSERDNKKP